MPAGELRERVGFYERETISDGYGNTTGDYPATASFIVSARIKPKLGGEQVLAGRLAGTNLVNVTVRYSAQAAAVTDDWRLKNENSGQVYNIRSIINPDEQRRYIEMLCEEGVAT